MSQVFWTAQAIGDLLGIREYIRDDSPHYADLVARELFAAVDRLQSFPASGRLVPERPSRDLREVLWRSYRIVYRFVEGRDRVEILLVFRAERPYPEGSLGGA